MAKRARRGAPEGEFEDPLKNYEAPQYQDRLERALIEDKVGAMRTQPIATVGPEATIEGAMRKMSEFSVACVLVSDGKKLLGLFSERDVLNKVVDRFDEIRCRPVTEVMTSDPLVTHESECPATAVNLMAVHGFRHVPVLDVNENLVGILGPRRVTSYLQEKLGH